MLIVPCGIPSDCAGRKPLWGGKKQMSAQGCAANNYLKSLPVEKVGKDAETGQKLCIYSAQGRGDAEVTVPISPSLNCQRTYSCKKDD